jgi:hypothetical protein
MASVLAGLAAAALAPPARAQDQLPPEAVDNAPPVVALLAKDGFGDPRNVYAWSMARFRGRIYVGTGRSVACVENITIDFYLRVSDRYTTDPLPGATCPADPYDMDLRAEIWEYTPRTDAWQRVYRSPADIKNPRAPGRFVARDIAFRGMVVHRDAQGRKRLYAAGVTADEYIPELRRTHPPRLLSTADGRHFRATPARDVIVRMPYGIFRPIGFRTMQVLDGRMFVTAIPGLTGDGAIFEVRRPWSPRRAKFRQVTPRSLAVFETEIFRGALYAGTGDRENGYGVYRMRGRGDDVRFRPIVTHGAGRGQIATSVVSMHVFKGRLYVGSSGWWNEEGVPISELIRIGPRGGWQVVAGPPRRLDGVVRSPISGLGDGFNNIFAAHFWRMTTYKGALVVGTNDWAYLVRVAYPGLAPWASTLIEGMITPDLGFDLWSSCNGRDWGAITRNAFAADVYDFGARNLVTAGSRLYIGSANHADGTNVFGYTGDGCPEEGTPPATVARRGDAAPAAPRALQLDVQRDGTVVSWRAPRDAPAGTRYRVLRTRYETATVPVMPPPVMANGFPAEGALPSGAAPGTPGSRPAELTLAAEEHTVGTTRRAFLVDRTARAGGHYAYEVVAEAPGGARSPSSNLQVVPDPRPEATLGAVRRAAPGTRPLPAATTVAALARDRRARAAALRALGRLRVRTARGSELGNLVDRVERRVRYAGIAGGS